MAGLGGNQHSAATRKSSPNFIQIIPCKHIQIWIVVFQGNSSFAHQQCHSAQRAACSLLSGLLELTGRYLKKTQRTYIDAMHENFKPVLSHRRRQTL